MADVRAAARALLAPLIADVMERAAQPFFQPIYDLASPSVTIGRVVLLGDAAFVARPHVGAGVTKAALDAICLAEAIAESGGDLAGALARYDRERRRLGDWIVARGRGMGALIKKRPKGENAPSIEELDRRARSFMLDYVAVASDIEKLTTDPRAGSDHASN